LGLSGEAGEVTEIVKKILRNKHGEFDSKDEEKIRKELGDVLWYLSALATHFCIDLESLAMENIAKLQDRKDRGVIKGSGDNR